MIGEPATVAGRELLDEIAPYARQGAPKRDVLAQLGRRRKLSAGIRKIEDEAGRKRELDLAAAGEIPSDV